MNQQILRLAASHFPRDGEGNIRATPETISEFAEAIVQECVNVLHDNELWNRHISHALKEHFGVEQ